MGSLVVCRAQSPVKVKALSPRDQGQEPGACGLGHRWPPGSRVSSGAGEGLVRPRRGG